MHATAQASPLTPITLVVAVASLGGVRAVSAVLRGLPATFAVPFVLVHHRATRSADDAELRMLQGGSALPVRLARAGASARDPGVTLIPAASTATVQADLSYCLRDRDAVDGGSSGGDSLFISAAERLAAGVIGIVFTGRLHDGTEGARAIKRHGGWVLAQDPATALAPAMPSSAIATGCVDYVLPPERIAPALVSLAMATGAAELLRVATPPWARLYEPGVPPDGGEQSRLKPNLAAPSPIR